jgi:hypothetical protein
LYVIKIDIYKKDNNFGLYLAIKSIIFKQ